MLVLKKKKSEINWGWNSVWNWVSRVLLTFRIEMNTGPGVKFYVTD
jgi:hypothetical protein